MCFSHQWSKWEQYEEKGIQILGRIAPKSVQGKEIPYTDLRQKRTCKKCNKVQDELVREL